MFLKGHSDKEINVQMRAQTYFVKPTTSASLLYLDILAMYELQLDFWAHGQASLTAPP